MATTIFGIRNCDTMKKARAWLEAQGIAHDFHDYKHAGIDRARLEAWCDALGWERVINRAGTTFRKLPDDQKEGLTEAKAIALMLAQPGIQPFASRRSADNGPQCRQLRQRFPAVRDQTQQASGDTEA